MRQALVIIGVLALLYVAYFFTKSAQFYKSIYKNGNNAPTVAPEKKQFTILFLGYGGLGHDGPYLTDSLMVATIDIEKNKVSLLSLPRDLWVELPTKTNEGFHAKINSIYALLKEPEMYPSVIIDSKNPMSLLKNAVTTLTGLPVDYFASLDFKGFEKAVDVLGGVEVQVVKTFDDYEYPIEGKDKDLCGKETEFAQIEPFLKPGFNEEDKKKLFTEKPELETFFKNITEDPKEAFPCRYEHLHFDAGLVKMNGETALKYVRSRHSLQDGSDFGRGARQQQFVQAIRNKLMQPGTVGKILPLMDEMKNHIATDIPPDALTKFVAETKDVGQYKMVNVRMSDKDVLRSSFSEYGGYILIPALGMDKWTAVHRHIQNGIMEITPTPIPSPSPSPTMKPARRVPSASPVR